MKNLKANEIRNLWLNFWATKNHYLYDSQPLLPHNDESILFINSGVATLKSFFDGSIPAPNARIANSQKCLRTNDIENVGLTSRHHTFFEMLGNFSIGDYFKKEAIEWALQFLMDEKYLNLEADKLYYTIHPEDQNTKNILKANNISEKQIVELEANFWEIGKGPGGPNFEIFYDRGSKYNVSGVDNQEFAYLETNQIENDRYIEIWNIVFSEFNCDPENKKRSEYKTLPAQNIDTGMGLERIACIMQEVDTNFDIDLFVPLKEQLEQDLNCKMNQNLETQKSLRIIMDHARALTFAISDGIIPANTGRGYVLRRILRRAVLKQYLLGQEKPYLAQLAPIIADSYADFYPELKTNLSNIIEVIHSEESKFYETLNEGVKLFNEIVNNLALNQQTEISGESAFKLYDTFGFPFELTEELAFNNNLKIDEKGFLKELEKQKNRSRANQKNTVAIHEQNDILTNFKNNSAFIGYEKSSTTAHIILILKDGKSVSEVLDGECQIILDQTPFYAESGGQIYDLGQINNSFVINVQKTPNGQHLHTVKLQEKLVINQTVKVEIDELRRFKIAQNHTATHLLHYALKKVLGESTNQAGSSQNETRIRFDFNNSKPVTYDQLVEIEKIVNEQIEQNHLVKINIMPLSEAQNIGAMALFEDKYGDEVRVVTMGDSIELCGGTHVKTTGEVKNFYLLQESGIGSGIRRIEAMVDVNISEYAKSLVHELKNEINNSEININLMRELIQKLGNVIRVEDDYYSAVIVKAESKINDFIAQKEAAKLAAIANLETLAHEIATQKEQKNNYNYIEANVEIDAKNMKKLADLIETYAMPSIIILKMKDEAELKETIVVKVSKTIINEHNAQNILKEQIGDNGRGGGNYEMAQGVRNLK